MSLPYYKRYTRDILDGTVGMGFELKTAYSFVLDLIYHHNGSLADEPRYIAGQLECSVRKWTKIRQKLIDLDKIQISGGFVTNYRAVSELESLGKFQDKQKINAQKPRVYGGKRKNLAKPKPNHTDTDTDTDILSNESISGKPPLPEKKEVKENPVDILKTSASEEAAKSYTSYRTRIRKPLTITAAKRLKTQLDAINSNGGDPSDALGMCEEKGWTSIKSDWYFNEKRTQNNQPTDKITDNRERRRQVRRKVLEELKAERLAKDV